MMNAMRSILAILAACTLLFSLSCGGGKRMLTSITVTPASTTLQNAGNNQIQFSAMGNYNSSPMTAVTPVLWSIGNPFAPGPFIPGVTVDQTGLAKCTTFVGTISIFATAPPDPKTPLSSMGPLSPQVSGTAQLTCQ